MKKEWFKKSDLWMIFAFTMGTIIHHIFQRLTKQAEEIPPISFHVAWNIANILVFAFVIVMYRKFMQKKSDTSPTQVSAMSPQKDFFMVRELPAWAQKVIRENRGKEGSVSNFSWGKDRLSILGGFSIIFNGRKVYEDMKAVGPEPTINFSDLPKEVQDEIRLSGRNGSASIMTSDGQLLIDDGKAYFNRKLVININ